MCISDVKAFKPAFIQDEWYVYSAVKTDSAASVNMGYIMKGILEKYGGVPPIMAEQYFNREIKKVFKSAGLSRPIVISYRQRGKKYHEIKPLDEVVSSHTGRKTFISVALALGMSVQEVMNASGHCDYRAMKPYIQQDMDQEDKKWKEKFDL
jgi:integrase